MKKTVFFILILIVLVAGIYTKSYADDAIISAVHGIYHGESSTTGDMKTIASRVLGAVQVVGYAISLITLSILGIKYMYAATAEKAKIKEQLIPYVIGCVLLFGASVIIGIISTWAQAL